MRATRAAPRKPQIIGAFDPNPAVVGEGVRYLRVCCSVNCLAYAAMYTCNAFATGVGNAWFAMCNALLHAVAVRLALSWWLGQALGYGALGLYWAEMLSPALPCLMACLYFYSGRWKQRVWTGR